MTNRKLKIENEKDYNATMVKIDALMKKGEDNLTNSCTKNTGRPHRIKMYERRLKQKELATLLGIAEPKLFQIVSRKRKPDVAFLKAAHEQLGIDGNVLLEFS